MKTSLRALKCGHNWNRPRRQVQCEGEELCVAGKSLTLMLAGDVDGSGDRPDGNAGGLS